MHESPLKMGGFTFRRRRNVAKVRCSESFETETKKLKIYSKHHILLKGDSTEEIQAMEIPVKVELGYNLVRMELVYNPVRVELVYNPVTAELV
jgi:hypothetical protein